MFAATLGIGVAVVLAISTAPLYASRVPVTRSIRLGASLVLAAAGVLCCCAASGTLPLRPLLALTAFLLFLVGSLLLLADDGDEPDGAGGDDGDPSWWPEFEAGFRRYASRPRQPVAGR